MSTLAKNVTWNAMLALIPVVLAYIILWTASRGKSSFVRNLVVAVLSIVWFVFLPNTCYLLTEWRHFLGVLDANDLFLRSQADRWVFIELSLWWLFYFLYSGFGMLTFALAIRPMEHLAVTRGAATWFWAVPFFVALSLGVYLGLVLRFNSWDLVSNPRPIWQAIVDIGGRPVLGAFILTFGLFLWVAYEAVDVWVDGLADRWSRVTGRRIHLGPKIE